MQYFMHYGPAAFRFELAGELDTDGAFRLERDWLKASSLIGQHALIVDLTFVTGAQAAGRSLLARWYAAGARFVAQSKTSRALIEAITGRPLNEATSNSPTGDTTWLSFAPAISLTSADI
jgi:hypothetical protein